MALITWASLTTFEEDDSPDIDIPHFDKFVHFCFYFGAVFLGVLFVRETAKAPVSLTKTLIYLVSAAIGYGIMIEMLQFYVALDRQGDPMDALANGCGAIAGRSP